eukprot:m.267001 g.267001  ORF g.267001 m.267001 type:complete len:1354 (-) comp22799_c4_seq3:41-4102(-)
MESDLLCFFWLALLTFSYRYCCAATSRPPSLKLVALHCRFTLLGTVILCLLLGYHFQRQYRVFRRQRRHYIRQQAHNFHFVQGLLERFPAYLDFSENEQCQWLNNSLSKLWPFIKAATEQVLLAEINPQLAAVCPGFLSSLGLAKVDIGRNAPRIVTVNLVKHPRNPIDAERCGSVWLDVTLKLSEETAVVLEASSGPLSVRVGLQNVEFTGVFRLALAPLDDAPPFFKALSISLLEKPLVNFNLVALNVPLMTIPGLAPFIKDLLTSQISSVLLWPKKVVVPVDNLSETEERRLNDTSGKGVLRIRAQAIEGLTTTSSKQQFKNLYLECTLDGESKSTSTATVAVRPTFGRGGALEFIVMDDVASVLHCSLQSKDTKDKVGYVDIGLSNLVPQVSKRLHVPLVGSTEAVLVCDLTYLPFEAAVTRHDLQQQAEQLERGLQDWHAAFGFVRIAHVEGLPRKSTVFKVRLTQQSTELISTELSKVDIIGHRTVLPLSPKTLESDVRFSLVEAATGEILAEHLFSPVQLLTVHAEGGRAVPLRQGGCQVTIILNLRVPVQANPAVATLPHEESWVPLAQARAVVEAALAPESRGHFSAARPQACGAFDTAEIFTHHFAVETGDRAPHVLDVNMCCSTVFETCTRLGEVSYAQAADLLSKEQLFDSWCPFVLSSGPQDQAAAAKLTSAPLAAAAATPEVSADGCAPDLNAGTGGGPAGLPPGESDHVRLQQEFQGWWAFAGPRMCTNWHYHRSADAQQVMLIGLAQPVPSDHHPRPHTNYLINQNLMQARVLYALVLRAVPGSDAQACSLHTVLQVYTPAPLPFLRRAAFRLWPSVAVSLCAQCNMAPSSPAVLGVGLGPLARSLLGGCPPKSRYWLVALCALVPCWLYLQQTLFRLLMLPFVAGGWMHTALEVVEVGTLLPTATLLALVTCPAHFAIYNSLHLRRQLLIDQTYFPEREQLTDAEHNELLADLPLFFRAPEVEKVEWVNEFLACLWPRIRRYVEPLVLEAVNEALPVPRVALTKFSLGRVAPVISGIASHHLPHTQQEKVTLDVCVTWAADCTVELEVKPFQRRFPVALTDVYIDVKGRITLEPLLAVFPCFTNIKIQLLTAPDVQASLHVLREIPVSSLPGFDQLLALIAERAAGYVTFPHELDIPVLDVTSDAVAQALRPRASGLLRVFVHRASGLKNVDLFGASDPYVILTVEDCQQSESKQTKVIDNNLNPLFNEAFEFVVHDLESAQLHTVLRDSDLVDKDLGTVQSIALARLRPCVLYTGTFPVFLHGHKNGRLFWSVQFQPLAAPGSERPTRSKLKPLATTTTTSSFFFPLSLFFLGHSQSPRTRTPSARQKSATTTAL